MHAHAILKPRPLEHLFAFLRANHQWNSDFQQRELARHLTHCTSPNQRLQTLLHVAVTTQTKPRIGKLSRFWRALAQFSPSDEHTQEEFVAFLEREGGTMRPDAGHWHRLYCALLSQPGWGRKTAALFVRTVVQLHRGRSTHHFWPDGAVATIADPDCIYLPVDKVIINIFAATGVVSRPDFDSVNKLLLASYDPEEMLVWDDLWFWGYFTQNAQGDTRTFGWNSDKFWCEPSAPKESEPQLKVLGEQFLSLIQASKHGGQPAARELPTPTEK